jgi:methyltransferase (TIGR00027 family)
MRNGKGSRTAQFVAYNRALGALAPTVPGFSDPTAEHFLSDRWRAKITKMRRSLADGCRESPYPFWFRQMGIFNQFRKVVIDQAIWRALPFDQLVILGAGLDGRAWHLPGLESTTVYEVDHPDTQHSKRERAQGMKLCARNVCFVEMDFSRADLAVKLLEAGYDPKKSSFWLWEGVTMYLSADDCKKTLNAIARISFPGSRLAQTYLSKKNGKVPRSLFLLLLGEPIRGAYTPDEMTQATNAAGWSTESDSGIEDWERKLTPHLVLTEKKVRLQWGERLWVGRRTV